MDWRSKLDTQKGAVLATELQNNSCKLAKWTLQALLAGSDQIKFGYVCFLIKLDFRLIFSYVSRSNVRNSADHVILGTQQYKPTEFATNITLNLDNAWGILRCIIDACMKQPKGKYLLMKDPNKVRFIITIMCACLDAIIVLNRNIFIHKSCPDRNHLVL